jgi:hypothetical protein
MRAFMSDYFGKLDARNVPRHFFWGAVQLDYESAVKADIAKQDYTVCPRYWYIEATLRCVRCGNEFMFSVDEQRFWYEELRFWVDSRPTRCAPCRGDLRRLKAMQQEYDRAIKRVLLRTSDAAEKLRLIELIEGLEAGGVELPEKTRANLGTLRVQIARMEA